MTKNKMALELEKTREGLKVAGYMRCSTNKQELESQEYQLTKWAEQYKHELMLFTDFAVSGKKELRNGLGEMMDRCRKGEFDAVAVIEISRFGRSIKIIYQIIEELSELGVKVILIKTNTEVDYNSVEGRALLGALSMAADIEWMLIKERNERGREKIKREKIKVGRKRAEDKDISLEAVLSLKQNGYGFRRIAAELNTSIATISRMLKRYEDGQLRNVTISNQNPTKTGQNSGGVSFKPENA